MRDIAHLVRTHFPAFYEEYGPELLDFVQAYYEWREYTNITRFRLRTTNHGFTSLSTVAQPDTAYDPKFVIRTSGNDVDILEADPTVTSWFRIISTDEGVGLVSTDALDRRIVRGTGTRFQDTDFALSSTNAKYILVDGQIHRVRNVISNTLMTLYEELPNALSNVAYEVVVGSRPRDVREATNNPNTIKKARDFLENLDVDTANSLFLEYMARQYLIGIPSNFAADKRFLIKHVLDIYRSKGSPRGFKLLFRMLFGLEIDIYYPYDDTFTTSSSRWIVPRYIEVTDSPVIAQIEGQPIRGAQSGATAIVERTAYRYVNDKKINTLYLSNISGVFAYGENVILPNESTQINIFAPKVVGSISGLAVTDGGQEFAVGDTVMIESDQGAAARGIVRSIRNTTGEVDFALANGGYGYTLGATISITGGGGTGASFIIGGLSDTTTYTYFTDVIAPYVAVTLGSADFGFPPPGAETLSTVLSDALASNTITIGSIASIVNEVGGSNYVSPPTVTIKEDFIISATISDGFGNIWGNNAIVTADADGFNGIATSVEITHSGYGYDPAFGVSFRSLDGDPDKVGAGTVLMFDAGKEPGYWIGEADRVSWTSHLIDSFYYQAFSYEIRTRLDYSVYAEIIQKLGHPIGMNPFGRFDLVDFPINTPATATMAITQS